MRKALLIFLLAGLFPGWLPAQGQEPELDSDRPSITQSPTVVPQGRAQLEAGLQYQRSGTAPWQVKEFSYPDVLLRLGLLDWVELRLHAVYKNERRHLEGPVAVPDESGFDQMQAGFKVHLSDGKGLVPAIGFLGNLTLPVGAAGFRPPQVAPEGWLLFESALSEKVYLEYNAGYRKRQNQDEYRGEAIYSAAANIEATDQFAYFVEFFGLKSRAAAPEHLVDAGIMLQVQANLQLDLSAGRGVSRPAPNFFVAAGLSWRLPR